MIDVSEDEDVVRTIYDYSFGRGEGENNLTPVIDQGALSSWKRKRDYKARHTRSRTAERR